MLEIFLSLVVICYGVNAQSSPMNGLQLALFTSSPNAYNTIRKGYADSILSSAEMKDEREISLRCFTDEHCILECLKNMHCIRYSFNSTQNLCKIRLHPTVRKIEDSKMLSKIFEIGIDYSLCADSIYCTSKTDKKVISLDFPLCDPFKRSGEKCQHKITYELSKWGEWSSCSASCGDALRKRQRTCLKKYYDVYQKQFLTKAVKNDWLCKNGDISEAVQIDETENCEVAECVLHTDWSEWTACSRYCNGFRNRSRTCLGSNSDEYCKAAYLDENEPCGLFDCERTIIKLQTGKETKQDDDSVDVKGTLSLYEVETGRTIRIFTHRPDEFEIANIARVACRELGLNDFNWVVAKPANEIKNQYQGNIPGFLHFINKQSVNGIYCTGNEKSLTHCQIAFNATLNTNLFELELECLLDGYWSHWGQWSDCSATCGAGARSRLRTCSNPAPTVSDYKNGIQCEGTGKSIEVCTMPRCKIT